MQVPLSAQDLCFCSSYDGCGGGFPESAFDYVKSSGIVSGNQQTFSGSGPDPDPFAGAGYSEKTRTNPRQAPSQGPYGIL